MAFLTMAITISTKINPGAPEWNILEWFQNNIRNAEMVCSRTVSEQTFLTVLENIEACSRIVLEQTIRIFLKLVYNHSK